MTMLDNSPPTPPLHPLFLPRGSRTPRKPPLTSSMGLIPFPRLATYNVISLSQYANTTDSLARRHNLIANIKALL